MDIRVLDEAIEYLNNTDSFKESIYFDDFDINTIVFEQEMFESLSGIILESDNDIYILNESMKETILTYLNKIVDGVQSAWNKFKATFTNKEINYLDKLVKPIVESDEEINFKVKNYKAYTFVKFDSIKILPFDYERMKESLDTVDKYISTNYPNIPYVKNNNILKQAIEESLGAKVTDINCDKKYIQYLFKFVRTDYFEYRKSIENDIEQLNNSKENIQRMVDTIIKSETSALNPTNSAVTTKNEAYTFSNSTILEDSTEANNNSDDKKMQIQDNDGETTSGNGSDAKKENSERNKYTKAVTTYMNASTKILSTKMKILNEAKLNSFAILKHCGDLAKDDPNINKKENKKIKTTKVKKLDKNTLKNIVSKKIEL